MTYNLLKSDGLLLVNLEDGQLDTTTSSLTLVGKNLINYGLYQNQNFIKLLENFASTSAPTAPLPGQLWFDKTAGVLRLKFYSGTSWKEIPAITVANTANTNPIIGDLFFDTSTNRLYIYNGTGQVLIGGIGTVAESAVRLQTARQINGVSFDGTASITITANTANALTRGNYLTGNQTSYNGSVADTWAVDVGTVGSATANKVVARDSAGDIWFNVGNGTATRARYADLAEKYLTDKPYEVGTVVVVGGDAEVCACGPNTLPIGVVSQNPGYMMNSDLEGGTYIALKGRVPVKVVGKVNNGDFLIAAADGHAQVSPELNPGIFAVALSTNNNDVGVVEAVIL